MVTVLAVFGFYKQSIKGDLRSPSSVILQKRELCEILPKKKIDKCRFETETGQTNSYNKTEISLTKSFICFSINYIKKIKLQKRDGRRENMAKFCIYCGKPLEEGEVCSCQKNEGAGGRVQIQKPQAGGDSGRQQDANGGSWQNQQQGPENGQQQGQPGGNGYYQQGQPGGNGYYQQGQPGGNGYYQQGQPGGNGYYQQGQPGGNGYYRQGRGPEMEWINNKTQKFVSGTKNMFSEILPVLKAPITHGRELMHSGSSAVGTEFIIAKCVLMILMMFLAVIKIKSNMGAWGDYIEVPYFKMIFGVIVLTAGLDFLEAVLMHGITVAFGGASNIRMMLSLIGVRALYHSIGMAAAGLLALVSGKVALVVFLVFMLMSSYVEHHLYVSVVDCGEDRKLYAFLIEKICLAVVCLIFGFMFGDMITKIL